ncbi:hypothetical protein [Micromonospora coxensis]|uniref:LPXTG-motif cell wall anchor domain-containing protein n=1 Tax=Micromonospora coxensis TaxID=356852 RepID=A0A1C5H5H6_9ACTN|nr:hypothetical protein [Micromonospora coxensis]SCG41260.1 hypothetical protein GA0070614_0846 [Micromonospora coxensis]
MRLSRIIMALTVGLAVVAVPTAAGAAQPQPQPPAGGQPPPDYVPAPASLTVSPTTIVIGESVVLRGSNFGPNEIVDITVSVAPLAAPIPGQAPARRSDGSAVAMTAVAYPHPAPRSFTARTDALGRFTKRYRPSDVGRLTFTAVGRESDRTASATLTVLPKKRPPHHLPVTGDSLGTPLKVGGGLVGAGMVLMVGSVLWRRRNRFGAGSAS